MLYVVVGASILSAAVAGTAVWNIQQWRFDSERLAAQVNQRATERLRRQNANTAATVHETEKVVIREKFVPITERVRDEIEIEKVVYRNVCISAGGLRELANAARATGYTGEPGNGLPADQAAD